MIHALAALLLAAPAAGPSLHPAAQAGRGEQGPAGRAAVPVIRLEGSGPERAPVPLATAADVTRLCRALEPGERLRPTGDAVDRGEAEARHGSERTAALRERYVASVAASGVPFAPYEGPERRLSLQEPVQLAVAGGAARLWPTEARGLPVEAEASAARRVLDAQRRGTLVLSLVFDLPDDAACGISPRGKTRTLPVEPVAWRWLDGERVLAQGGAAAERPLVSAAQGARPKVDVGEPLAGPAELKKAVLARARELEACYEDALRRDPGLDGVLVADLAGPRAAISADSVGDEDLAACVQRTLASLAPAQGGRAAVPIRFELAPPVEPVKAH